MILITEQQETYSPELLENHVEFFSILEGHLLYKLLFSFPGDLIRKLDTIYILTSLDFNRKYLDTSFSNYSANPLDFEDSPYFRDILDKFPEPEMTIDESRCKHINDIIRRTKIKLVSEKGFIKNFSHLLNSSDEQLLIFTPFIKGDIKSLLPKLKSKKIVFISNYQIDRASTRNKLKKVNTNSYLNILNQLETINQKIQSSPLNKVKAMNFRAPGFLENFREGLFEKVNAILEENKTRLHFFGEESYVAKRTINYVLSSDIPIYYDLIRGVPQLETPSPPIVLKNFHSLTDPVEQRDLHIGLEKINESLHIILNGLKRNYVEYFNHYEEVPLPERKDFRKSITSIFISLLLEKGRYKSQNYKTFLIIDENLLDTLIPGDVDLETLDLISRNLIPVTENELLHNPDFWYALQAEVKSIREKSDADLEDKLVPQKIRFENQGGSWVIYGLGKDLSFKYSEYLGVKYLCVIIEYWKKYKKSIDVYKLRNIILRYTNQLKRLEEREKELKLNKEHITDLYETDRKAIAERINALKKNDVIKTFIKKHIQYSKYNYRYNDQGKIDCEVIDPYLPDL
jgi:hypothetical protein